MTDKRKKKKVRFSSIVYNFENFTVFKSKLNDVKKSSKKYLKTPVRKEKIIEKSIKKPVRKSVKKTKRKKV
jgi:hypothetical protein